MRGKKLVTSVVLASALTVPSMLPTTAQAQVELLPGLLGTIGGQGGLLGGSTGGILGTVGTGNNGGILGGALLSCVIGGLILTSCEGFSPDVDVTRTRFSDDDDFSSRIRRSNFIFIDDGRNHHDGRHDGRRHDGRRHDGRDFDFDCRRCDFDFDHGRRFVHQDPFVVHTVPVGGNIVNNNNNNNNLIGGGGGGASSSASSSSSSSG
jgi:hypothetical protein